MKHTFKKSFKFLLIILALIFSSIGVIPAYAATLTVTNTADSGTGSLRDTIASAGVGDTITFDATLSGGIIYLASTLTLSKNITIDGSALASKITISGDSDNNGITGDVRVFYVGLGVTVTLNSMIITRGCENDFGGGIYNDSGTLTVTNSVLYLNNAGGYGGGIYNNGGTLTVTNSTLSGNTALLAGGGIYGTGTLTVTNGTLSDNSAGYTGGGIANNGVLTVTNSTLSGNSAPFGRGGGIDNYSGTLTVTNNTLSGNSAGYRGGGIYNYSGTLNYANTIIANSSYR